MATSAESPHCCFDFNNLDGHGLELLYSVCKKWRTNHVRRDNHGTSVNQDRLNGLCRSKTQFGRLFYLSSIHVREMSSAMVEDSVHPRFFSSEYEFEGPLMASLSIY